LGDGTLVLAENFNTTALITISAGILEFDGTDNTVQGIAGDGELLVATGATLSCSVSELTVNLIVVDGTLILH